ncbi:hypothetical protein [Dyadobacter sp. CY323]|uniref:hypothetical protein n=1 Tax=Dyadobacter sp. CY323 TaxID=2907302 RepID=UPI001F3AA790|nr:hypothetical protein [Dyadobacter sp. CY323]MCE6988530.1 hypothetical protein [Dyadobacter sp. CY323]
MSSSIDSSVKVTKPFSSDTDKEKQELLQDADLYKERLEGQWTNLKSDATEYGKKALVIGGVVVTTFVVMNAILPKTKKDKEREKEKQRLDELVLVKKSRITNKKTQATVMQAVQGLAWTFAIGWARQKLKHLIEDERKTE